MVIFLLVSMTILLMVYLMYVIQLHGDAPNMFIVLPLVVGIALTGVLEYRWISGENQGSHLIKYASDAPSGDLECQKMFGALLDRNPADKTFIDKSDPRTVHMKYETCVNLIDWIHSDKNDRGASSAQAFSLHLLIFESNRIADSSTREDTVRAECAATAQYVDVATYAGASEDEAKRMLELYKTDWYPQLPEEMQITCP